MWQNGVYAATIGVLFALMGGVFFVFIDDDFGHFLGAVFILLGVMIAIRGVTAIRNSRKYPRAANKTPATSTTLLMDRFK